MISVGVSVHYGSRSGDPTAWYLWGAWVLGVSILALLTLFIVVPLVSRLPKLAARLRPKPEPGNDFIVLKALYHGVDVTPTLVGLVKDGELHTRAHPDDLGIADPAPGVQKRLEVEFWSAREFNFVSYADGDSINLP